MDKYIVDNNGEVIEYSGENDRRAHLRFPINLVVRYYEDLNEPHEDLILNISMGGVFIRSDNPLENGARIHLDFEIPPKIRYLGRFEGEVVKVNTDESKYPMGMFVRFVDAGAEELKRLEDFLEGHRRLLEDDA